MAEPDRELAFAGGFLRRTTVSGGASVNAPGAFTRRSRKEPAPEPWRRGWRTVWLLVVLFIAVWAIGKSWDERYHVTNLFDTFWSPPHLFVYSGYLLVALLYLRLLLGMRETHAHLGPPVRVPFLAFPIPASLLLLGLGLLFTGVAGLLDSKYHEAIGLRETHWSVPHLMLGTSGLLVVMGFAASFVALGKARGPGGFQESRTFRWTLSFAFWGMLAFATGAALGPAFNVAVPQMYQAVLDNRIPGVQVVIGDDLRWALETYVAQGVTRAHVAVVPVGVFIVTTLLAALRKLSQDAKEKRPFEMIQPVSSQANRHHIHSNSVAARGPSEARDPKRQQWFGLGWALFYTALTVWDAGVAVAAWRLYETPGPAPAHVLPFPVLAMVVAVALLERRAGRWSYAVAGGAAGAVWGGGPGLLLGAAGALAGREAGRWLRRVLAEPSRRSVAATALLLGVVVPLVLGGIDIALRTGKYWWVV